MVAEIELLFRKLTLKGAVEWVAAGSGSVSEGYLSENRYSTLIH